MVIAKREDVTKKGFCKIFWRKLRLRGEISYYYLFNFISIWSWNFEENSNILVDNEFKDFKPVNK